MKSGAYLINTPRGQVIDEKALVETLRKKRIAGAGLDVFEMEPLLPPPNPFLTLDNTVLTSHIGYITREGFRTYFMDACAEVSAWLSGRPVQVLTP